MLSLDSSGQKSQLSSNSPLADKLPVESVSNSAPKFAGLSINQLASPISTIGFSQLITLPDIEVIDDTPPQTSKKNPHDSKIIQSASTMPESSAEEQVRKTVLFPEEDNIEIIE